MYSVAAFGNMITDKIRMAAYVRALGSAIKSDSIVLDIGTGTGIFALLACKFGARRVYAIEPDDAIQVARAVASASGYASRIEFIQALSTKIDLPERADVIISDLRGALPLYGLHINAIVDARRRFLAPGGSIIPQRDTLWAAVAEAPRFLSRSIPHRNGNDFGFNMSPVTPIVTNTIHRGRVSPEQLLVTPQCWAKLDYNEINAPDVSANLDLVVSQKGTGDGLSIWFDAELTEGVGFSNAPHEPELVYGSLFFPWSERVNLDVGDTVSVSLQAKLIDDAYLWRWATRVLGKGSRTEIKATFRQSTFFGVPLSHHELQKRAANYVPALDEDGKIDRFILVSMNGSASVGDIARDLADEFPQNFASKQEALTRVGKLSKKYSRGRLAEDLAE